ncbi:MAG: hypothetical protein HY094_09930 [Candidatus Melainabacteria bacterium]|nr:hypothetical protein [Candidatus Melainabacteria bacterium]
MGNFSQSYLEKTIKVWQPNYPDRTLTIGDAMIIAENVIGFVELLIEWKKKRIKEEQK